MGEDVPANHGAEEEDDADDGCVSAAIVRDVARHAAAGHQATDPPVT